MALDQHQAVVARYVAAIGGSAPAFDDDGFATFELSGCPATVNVKDGGSRLRGRAVVAAVTDVDAARAWLHSQPVPPTSELSLWDTADRGPILRLVWERDVDLGSDLHDPIHEELHLIHSAWTAGADVDFPRIVDPLPDPRDAGPQQAWLMLGDQASFPTDEQIGEAILHGDVGVFETMWTAAKQTQPGDLLIFYFTGERKAAHFVARAASAAFPRSDLAVNADRDVQDQQWWVYCTPLLPIEPLSYQQLREASDGQLLLRGRSGKFMKPDTIAALPFISQLPEFQEYVDDVAKTPAGRAELPPPESMTLADIVALAGGALTLESDVEQYVVEPLLRSTLADTGLEWMRQFPVGRKRADYVVTRDGFPMCVIEVKLAINNVGHWHRSPDVAQVVGYARTLDVPAVLIDTQRVALIERGAVVPTHVIDRSDFLSRATQTTLRTHLGVDQVTAPDRSAGP